MEISHCWKSQSMIFNALWVFRSQLAVGHKGVCLMSLPWWGPYHPEITSKPWNQPRHTETWMLASNHLKLWPWTKLRVWFLEMFGDNSHTNPHDFEASATFFATVKSSENKMHSSSPSPFTNRTFTDVFMVCLSRWTRQLVSTHLTLCTNVGITIILEWFIPTIYGVLGDGLFLLYPH